MKNVVALIPARSGSKGVPNKNINPLCGVPLIAYTIAVAKKSELIDRIIVSTDSEKYATIARKYGAEVPFLRPSAISGDKATDIQFIEHVINWFENNESFVPEYFVHLRPTTPIRDSEVVDCALRSFIGSQYTALRSCHKMSESSKKTFEIDNNKLKSLCGAGFNIESANLSRQSYPQTFDANGYVDIVKLETVKNDKTIHGDKVQAFITDKAYEIDEVDDIDFLEYILKKKDKDYIASLFQQ